MAQDGSFPTIVAAAAAALLSGFLSQFKQATGQGELLFRGCSEKMSNPGKVFGVQLQ